MFKFYIFRTFIIVLAVRSLQYKTFHIINTIFVG